MEGVVLLVLISGLVYFTPSFVAHNKNHHNLAAIFALNLLLGWTFIGWVAALVWALSKPPK